MNRLQCITALRDEPAMGFLRDCIEQIASEHDRWRAAASPEATVLVREILASLTDLEADMIARCTTLGLNQSTRLEREAGEEMEAA